MDQTRKRLETNGAYESCNEPLNLAVYKIVNKKKLNRINENEKSNLNTCYNSNDCVKIFSNRVYLTQREITKQIDLPMPGSYLIIPSLFEKNVEMKFLLRIFVQKPLKGNYVEQQQQQQQQQQTAYHNRYDFYVIDGDLSTDFDGNSSIITSNSNVLYVNSHLASQACSIQ
jgi:hypothetical protein